MDRWGSGSASNDEGIGSPGEQSERDDALSGAVHPSDARAAEIPELTRRALTAEARLLTYLDELEEEVHRLRRQLGIEPPYEGKDGAA
jgi:hypothetical protein